MRDDPDFSLVSLHDAPRDALLGLMNDPRVRAHLVIERAFTDDDYRAFIAAKSRHWAEHGFGPWAFMVRGELAGWGGMQDWNGREVELGIVLSPVYWGWGTRIARLLIAGAFEDADSPLNRRGLDSILVLFPASRPNRRAIERAGFVFDGDDDFEGERFARYRLTRARWASRRQAGGGASASTQIG